MSKRKTTGITYAPDDRNDSQSLLHNGNTFIWMRDLHLRYQKTTKKEEAVDIFFLS